MLNKLLILIIFSLAAFGLQADNYLRFTHIGSADGLSQNTVNTIFKDRRGFMWFGTNDGLNRFDGKNFKIFQQSHTNSNSIGANGITVITEDSDNHLWIGTKQNGISIYYPETDSFVVIRHIAYDTASIAGNYVAGILFVEPHTILVGFSGGKIDIINTKTLKIKHFNTSGMTPFQRIQKASFAKDKKGNLWIGTASNGLMLLDTLTKTVKKIPMFLAHRKDFGEPEPVGIMDIKVFDNNHLLIATYRTGLILFDVVSHHYKQLYLNQKPDTIRGNYNITNSLEIINDSILWITTMDVGLVEFNMHTNKKIYYNISTNNNNFGFNGLLKIYKDDQGIVWIGSNGMGLYYYNPQSSFFVTASSSNSYKPYLHFSSVRSIYKIGNKLFVGGYSGFDRINLSTKNCTQITDNIIPYYITELPDDPGYLWLGLEVGTDLIRFNKRNNNMKHIHPVNLTAPNNWFPFYKILPYGDSLIWLGSGQGNLILYNYKSRKREKIYSPATVQNFVHGDLLALLLRNDNQLWVGSTTDGIIVLNPKTGKIVSRFVDSDTGTSPYYVNAVKTIVKDHKGTIWVGTGNGLYKFIDSTNSFKGYFTSNGLPNNTVYCILEDLKGNLWLSTNKGISMFNPEKELFVNFDSKYGLQDNEFNTNACFKDSTGFFCFGGIKGLTWFYPDKFRLDTLNTVVQITEVDINDKVVPASVLNSKIIDIPFKTHSVNISFAGLNYLNPYSISYRYKLNEGNWIFLGSDNNINLGWLPEYGINKLIINASNTQGQWSKYNKAILFDYKKPVYIQIWFVVSVLLFVALIVAAYFYHRTFVLRRRQKFLEREIYLATQDLIKAQQKLEREIKHKEIVEKELRQSNATKNKVFSIIAHDLINPFNALLGFSELLRENINKAAKDELKSYADVMYHSSRILFEMVQNILTWSRAQQNKIVSTPEMVNLYNLVQLVFDAQNQHATSKEIHLLNSVPKNMEAYFDRNMLEIIFRNLVSNAIKFSNKNSTIEVGAHLSQTNVTVEIKDEGIGMSQEKAYNLFNPDQDIRTKGTSDERGTGLGLLLVKELIDLHKASIHVKSKEGEGTRFILLLQAKEFKGKS